MRSWVFRNRARLEALCGPSAARKAGTRPAPGTLVRPDAGKPRKRRGPRVVVVVPARRRR